MIGQNGYQLWNFSTTIKFTLAQDNLLNLGYHPNIGKDINSSTEDSPGTEQFLKMIKEISDKVESALKKTNETMKRKWDSKRKPEIE